MPLTLGESARNVIASHDTAITTVLAYATMSATACGWREEGMLDKISESGGGGALRVGRERAIAEEKLATMLPYWDTNLVLRVDVRWGSSRSD